MYSIEVERATAALDAVAEVAVIGIPDDLWGERVHAVVVPVTGAAFSEQEITGHRQSMIDGYKAPKSVDVRTDPLPKSGAGKILKQDIRREMCNAATDLAC